MFVFLYKPHFLTPSSFFNNFGQNGVFVNSSQSTPLNSASSKIIRKQSSVRSRLQSTGIVNSQADIVISLTDVKKGISVMKNWNAPCPDGVRDFWFKKFTSVHESLTVLKKWGQLVLGTGVSKERQTSPLRFERNSRINGIITEKS